MKTRSKLLLAAVSLLTVSVAATATSAYAWYTANRQVSATVNSLGVQSTTGSLSIEHDNTIKQTYGETKIEASDNTITYETNAALTDVSSEGNGTFIKPKWDAAGSTIIGSYTQNGEAPNKQVKLYGETMAYGVVSLGIKFTNKGTANVSDDLVLYLDPNVTVKATDSAKKMTSNSVVNSARFSICEVTDQGIVSAVYMYGNPKSGTGSSKETNTSLKEVNYSTEAISADLVIDEDNFIGKDNRVTDPKAEGNKAKAKGYLCDIPANTSKRYLITMWVEGTDKDCVFDTTKTDEGFEVSGLSLGLSFYALTQAPTKQSA